MDAYPTETAVVEPTLGKAHGAVSSASTGSENSASMPMVANVIHETAGGSSLGTSTIEAP